MDDNARPDIDELLDNSSLGTPTARLIQSFADEAALDESCEEELAEDPQTQVAATAASHRTQAAQQARPEAGALSREQGPGDVVRSGPVATAQPTEPGGVDRIARRRYYGTLHGPSSAHRRHPRRRPGRCPANCPYCSRDARRRGIREVVVDVVVAVVVAIVWLVRRPVAFAQGASASRTWTAAGVLAAGLAVMGLAVIWHGPVAAAVLATTVPLVALVAKQTRRR